MKAENKILLMIHIPDIYTRRRQYKQHIICMQHNIGNVLFAVLNIWLADNSVEVLNELLVGSYVPTKVIRVRARRISL